MIKRVLLAVALLASALIGFTGYQTVVAPEAGAICNGANSIDFGWHDGQRQVFHLVADFFYDNNCNYVTHYNTDCFYRAGGQQLSCAEGWLDTWNVIRGVGDGTAGGAFGWILFGSPNANWAGVQLAAPNSNAAWCQLTWYNGLAICAQSYSGSERHGISISTFQSSAQNGYGATVTENF